MIRTRRANNQMNNTTMVVLCCISFVTVWYKYGTQNGVYFGYTATEMITIKITKLDNREVIVTVKFNNQIKALIDQHRFEWQSTMTLNYELIYGTVIGNSFKFRPSFGISGDSLEILCIGDTETMLFIWKLIAENYKSDSWSPSSLIWKILEWAILLHSQSLKALVLYAGILKDSLSLWNIIPNIELSSILQNLRSESPFKILWTSQTRTLS